MRYFKGETYKVAGYKYGERGQINVEGIRKYKYFKYKDKNGNKVDIREACRKWQESEWLKQSKNDSDSVAWLFFREKWNEWAKVSKQELSHRTITDYNYAFDRIEKHIAPIFLNDITLKKLRLMISDLEEEAIKNKKDNHGVNKVIKCIRKALKWAMGKGYMDDFPIENLAFLEVNKLVVKTNDIREVELLLKYGTPMERAAVLFGFDCSCRPEEICNMRWEKLDLENRFGWISPNPDGWKPKGNKKRQIRLTERLITELNKMPKVSDYVFTNQYTKRYSNGGFCVFYKNFRTRVNEEIKIKEPNQILITGTCKTLRKDYATSRQACGADQKKVSLSMGHSDTKVTKQHYTNDQNEELKKLKEEKERNLLIELDKYEVPLNY
ncbi:integrase [Elusimicrobium simillimum]|uniref:tyrosine-type recombinase/integrase n=1 Tax=Elusimicrobium simillimum TaxID=3143438 RepID=UPI003C6F4652